MTSRRGRRLVARHTRDRSNRGFSSLANRQDPNHGWSVDVPGFWMPLVDAERVQYEDPLGAALLIVPAPDMPKPPVPVPGEAILPDGERLMTLGKNHYSELAVIATEGEKRIARYEFRTIQPGDSYILVFECEARYAAAYQDLRTRILTSFEVHARPPQRRPFPPKQFKPHGPVA
jgi:hypothetical protein